MLVEPYRAMERRWPTWTLWPETPEAQEEYDLRLSTIREVTRRLDALAPPGAALLTWWPGYAVEARTPLLEGLENQFGLRVGFYESDPALWGRLHVYGREPFDDLIRGRRAGVVVLGIWAGLELQVGRGYYAGLLDASGYVPTVRIGQAAIYVAPPITPR
jgi:hypothetical protein